MPNFQLFPHCSTVFGEFVFKEVWNPLCAFATRRLPDTRAACVHRCCCLLGGGQHLVGGCKESAQNSRLNSANVMHSSITELRAFRRLMGCSLSPLWAQGEILGYMQLWKLGFTRLHSRDGESTSCRHTALQRLQCKDKAEPRSACISQASIFSASAIK